MRTPAADDVINAHALKLTPMEEAWLETILKLALFQGVKIGGVYRHFKGHNYRVTNVVRDANIWNDWRVEYVQTDDVNHSASRLLVDFLGMHESGMRRFILVA